MKNGVTSDEKAKAAAAALQAEPGQFRAVPAQFMRISAPVPGTPGIEQSPKTADFPSLTCTEAISTFPVCSCQRA